MPQVGQRLVHQVAEEHQRDAAEPARAPFVGTSGGPVDVEGHALVLELLGAVPQPHRAQPRLGAVEDPRMREQPLGEHGREVLGGGRHRERVARIGAFHQRQPLARALGPAVDQALLLEVVVEQRMDAPVRGFPGR